MNPTSRTAIYNLMIYLRMRGIQKRVNEERRLSMDARKARCDRVEQRIREQEEAAEEYG